MLSALCVERTDCLLLHYMSASPTARRTIMTPSEMLSRERWLGVGHIAAGLPPLVIGAELSEAVGSGRRWAALSTLHAREPFVVSVAQGAVHLLLRRGCDKRGLLRGLLRAHLCRTLLRCPLAAAAAVEEEAAVVAAKAAGNESAPGPSLEEDFSERVLASEWVVEELLLEGRYARIAEVAATINT